MNNKGLYLISTIGSFVVTLTVALIGGLIPGLIAFIPTSLFLARLLPSFGQLIEDSIFQVQKARKGKLKICQNPLANPEKMIEFFKIKDTEGRVDKLKDEAITTFTSLKEKNSNGIKITYIANSQGLTKAMLTRAEKYGYIENFQVTPKGKKRLVAEKLLIGNYKKELFAKTRVYDFSFQLTDKERNVKEIKQLIKR